MPADATAARRSDLFLRRALLADAAASGAMGLLLAAAAEPLAGPLGLPAALLRGAGLPLLPFAAFVAWLGTRPRVPRAGAWAVVALNVVWVVDSLGLLATDWVRPAGLGQAFVVAQALAVLALAGLERVGLRRAA
jgi:hypothetical protein